MIKKWLHWRTRQSAPQQISENAVILESTAVAVRWPYGGGVWNRPTAVIVTADAQTNRYAIPDRTRQVLWTFHGITIAFALVSFLLRRGE